MFVTALATLIVHLLPHPVSIRQSDCSVSVTRAFARSPLFDPGARDEIDARWRQLGLPDGPGGAILHVSHDAALGPQAYRIHIGSAQVNVSSGDGDGNFYAAMTLAQLATKENGRWVLPCVDIEDRPALPWRILSDDVSRGPLPTMAYFERRIRTIAAFKMNGYSPYMESVYRTPSDPLPAPADAITPQQLAQLDVYAKRFHVALIPEQQTFAHMHGVLRIEQYASAAEFPHGFLLSPDSAVALGYLERTIASELQAVPHPPFFHIGSDETATLGEGTTAAYVDAHGGRSRVYADHVNAMAQLVKASGARPMVWDDGIENDPSIMAMLPRNTVVVNWHYDDRATFQPFIDTIARGGFQQMVAPGANNWSEIFPDLATALPNEKRFIDEGKASRVLGLFQTVWHDDGETLYENTWYPVLFAASAAWGDVDEQSFAADYPWTFFGVTDSRISDDTVQLGSLDRALGGATDKLFWADPFTDSVWTQRMQTTAIDAVRLKAEAVETDLMRERPALNATTVQAMLLSAQRFDALGRRYQIAREVRAYYDDATRNPKDGVRDLFWCKYWFWEQRDSDEALADAYAAAWRNESRDDHLASVLERYHLDAQHAIERADAIDRVTYDDFVAKKTLPAFDDVVH